MKRELILSAATLVLSVSASMAFAQEAWSGTAKTAGRPESATGVRLMMGLAALGAAAQGARVRQNRRRRAAAMRPADILVKAVAALGFEKVDAQSLDALNAECREWTWVSMAYRIGVGAEALQLAYDEAVDTLAIACHP